MRSLVVILAVVLALGAGSSPVLGKDVNPDSNNVASVAQLEPTPSGCVSVSVKVPDLMYHMIEVPPSDAALPQLWVDPSEFLATMKLLHSNGWRTLNPRKVAWMVKNCLPIPAKTFTITIDDGARNGYTYAYPILQEFGFTAAFAVPVGRLGKYKRSLTWEMVQELQDAGHEIANHSMDHDDLRIESPDGLYYEIEKSSQILVERLGKRPKTFVYPYGYYDNEAVAQIRASGFTSAFTTVYGCTFSWRDRFREERVRVNRSDSPQSVLRKVEACQ